MDANIVRDKTSDVTRVEHIFSDALLGRVNEKGEYVISEAIVKELIDNTKYFQKKINNKIYLYTFLESVERPYMMLMEYKLTEDKKQVTIKYSLIEEEYMADGLTINSIVTQIAFSKYNFSSDVILRAFRDFHVLIKKDEESQERKYQKSTPVANNTIQYNNIVDEKAEDNFDNFYEKAFVHIYQFLDNKKSSLSEQILKEYNTGLALHKTFFENADGKPLTNKVKFEILNNAIEKVTMTQPSSPEIQELKDAKQVALDGFVDQVKMTESKVIKDVMETADIATKGKILSVVANNVVAEKANKNDVVQEIAEKEVDKGKTVSLDNFGVVEKEEQKTFASLILEEPRVQEKDATQNSPNKINNVISSNIQESVQEKITDESLKSNEKEQASDVTQTRPHFSDEFIADAERSIADAERSIANTENILNQFKQHIAERSTEVKSNKQEEYQKLFRIKEEINNEEKTKESPVHSGWGQHANFNLDNPEEINKALQKMREEVDDPSSEVVEGRIRAEDSGGQNLVGEKGEMTSESERQ